MRTLLFIFVIFSLVPTMAIGQTTRSPKNLKQAILFLEQDCPESLKASIKITVDDQLTNPKYFPGQTGYDTINNWLNNENSRISRYLDSKGVQKHQLEVILKTFKTYLLNGTIKDKAILRWYAAIERKWKEEDENRATADSLRGFYIPRDLEDCFVQLNLLWSESIREELKNQEERQFITNLHHGFGTQMRNTWQFWGGSRLSKYFNDMGIYHPDDMSGIVLTSYHRYLNNTDIELENQIKHYQEYWEKMKESDLKRARSEFAEYRIGDTLEFKYSKGFTSKEQEYKYDEDECIARGILTGKNPEDLLIEVTITETCDRQGIIYYDNKGYKKYNAKTKKWEPLPKRIIKKAKKDEKQWFQYNDWTHLEE